MTSEGEHWRRSEHDGRKDGGDGHGAGSEEALELKTRRIQTDISTNTYRYTVTHTKYVNSVKPTYVITFARYGGLGYNVLCNAITCVIKAFDVITDVILLNSHDTSIDVIL